MGCRAVVPAGWSGSRARWWSGSPSARGTMRGFVSACVPLPASGAGSATGGCTSCCAARAGRPTTSSSSGSIARRSWPSAAAAGRSVGSAARWRRWCPIAANQRWSLDFTEDRLANGRRFRTANLKDDESVRPSFRRRTDAQEPVHRGADHRDRAGVRGRRRSSPSSAGGTTSRRRPSTSGGRSTAAWRSRTPSGSRRSRRRTGA